MKCLRYVTSLKFNLFVKATERLGQTCTLGRELGGAVLRLDERFFWNFLADGDVQRPMQRTLLARRICDPVLPHFSGSSQSPKRLNTPPQGEL